MKATALPMKVTPRDASERYYQIPGHEALFYTKVSQQLVPDEPAGACLKPYGGGWNIKGFHYTGLIAKTGLVIDLPFWKPLIKYYDDQNTSLPSFNLLNTLRSDYSGASLYSIFFDADKGAFTPPAGAADTWAFVVDQNGGSTMRYEANMFTADHIYIKVTDKNCAAQEINVMNYHNNSVDKDGVRGDLLGIGVKSTAIPAVASSPTAASPSTSSYADIDYSISRELDGGAQSGRFTVANCDIEDLTGAKLDGRLLQKGLDFFVEPSPDGGLSLRLSDALLASLSQGAHVLHIYFTDGDGEISFDLSSPLSTAAVPAVPATGGTPLALPVFSILLATYAASRAYRKKREGLD